MSRIPILVALLVLAAAPITRADDRDDERTGAVTPALRGESGRTVWRVIDVERIGARSIVLEPIDGDGPSGSDELKLDWTDFAGRMEAGSGAPMTLDNVKKGALVHVWFKEAEPDDQDILWIVFPLL